MRGLNIVYLERRWDYFGLKGAYRRTDDYLAIFQRDTALWPL